MKASQADPDAGRPCRCLLIKCKIMATGPLHVRRAIPSANSVCRVFVVFAIIVRSAKERERGKERGSVCLSPYHHLLYIHVAQIAQGAGIGQLCHVWLTLWKGLRRQPGGNLSTDSTIVPANEVTGQGNAWVLEKGLNIVFLQRVLLRSVASLYNMTHSAWQPSLRLPLWIERWIQLRLSMFQVIKFSTQSACHSP